jgi:hypothetical protein
MPSPGAASTCSAAARCSRSGVALLIIGLMLEAGATGAVKAIKVSAKLLAGRSRDMPGDQAPSGLDSAGPSSAPDSLAG